MTIAFQELVEGGKKRDIKVTRYEDGFMVTVGIVRNQERKAAASTSLRPTQLRYLISVLEDALDGASEAEDAYRQKVAQSDATDQPSLNERVASDVLSVPEDYARMRD